MVSSFSNDYYFNPIDLDVWLGLPAFATLTKSLTNEELIVELGNTIGSHLDLTVSLETLLMKSNFFTKFGFLMDEAVVYVLHVAEIVLNIGTSLLKIITSKYDIN